MRARLVLSAARRTLSPVLHRHWRVGCRRHSDLAEAAGGLALDGVRAEGGAVGVVDTEVAEHALAARDRGRGAAGPGGVGVRNRLGEVVAVVPGVAVVARGSGGIRDGHGGPFRGEIELREVKDVRELRRHVQEAVVSGAGSCSAREVAWRHGKRVDAQNANVRCHGQAQARFARIAGVGRGVAPSAAEAQLLVAASQCAFLPLFGLSEIE